MAQKTTGKKTSKTKPASGASRSAVRPAKAAARASEARPAPPRPVRKGITIKPKPMTKPGAPAAATGGKSGKATPNAAVPPPRSGKTRAGSGRAAGASPALDGLVKGKKPRSLAEVATSAAADSNGYIMIKGRRVRMISPKALPPSKKPKAAAEPADRTPQVEDIKAIKTKLGRKELNHYRDLLLLKRRQLVGDLSAMEEEALRSGGGNLSHMPIHMADIGTDTYDQDFMLGMAENERQNLREIDAALQRIEDRTYAVCQMTGKPIPKARLDAKPWAKYTIEAARMIESRGIRT